MKSSMSVKTEKKGRSFGEAGTRRFVVTMATFGLLLPAVLLLIIRTKETIAADNKLRAHTNAEKQSDEGHVERRRNQANPSEIEVPDAISPVAFRSDITIHPGQGQGQVEDEKEEAYVYQPELERVFDQMSVQQEDLPPDEIASFDQEDATVELVGDAEEKEAECLSSGRENQCGIIEVQPAMLSSINENVALTIGRAGAAPGTKDPVVGANYIMIKIASSAGAGSSVPYIKMYFESEQFPVFKLLGFSPPTPFPAGATIWWNLNTVSWALKAIDSDRWDNIILKNLSWDGIKIQYIRIVHSDMRILHWYPNKWLDGDKYNPFRNLSLADKIMETKLAMIPYSWIGQLHYAARELGKTGGDKYGSSSGFWSNEFANWCLRKNLWGIRFPGPNVYWWQIADWFTMYDRLHNNLPNPHPGDWVKLPNGRSGLFVQNLAGGFILTIEGDLGGAVRWNKRPAWQVQFKGNTR